MKQTACNVALMISLLVPMSRAASAANPSGQAATKKDDGSSSPVPANGAQELDFATRGFIGTLDQPKILRADGQVAWDLDLASQFQGPAPATVNPNLWEQAKLLGHSGLFKVADHVYQVRGFDAANMTIVESKSGFIIVDPLLYTESSAAAIKLVRQHLGDKPVVAVIYTHSHADHFGGAAGVVAKADVDAGKVKVIAPAGLVEAFFSESMIMGNAMGRRGQFQIGGNLATSPSEHVTSGGSTGVGNGTLSFIPPSLSIADAHHKMVLDGIDVEFELTPGTEAPAEMNVYFPQLRTLCMADNAADTMNNLLPPRGALVRDAKAWSSDLDEALRLFGTRTDYVVLGHSWPRFGNGDVKQFLADQSDMYRFIHDQTVRMMNQGMTPSEIAEAITLPAGIGDRWYDRGYYGSLKANAKAVYQRYLGWYDANPANLDPLPTVETSGRYVEAMGGADHVIQMGKAAVDHGDYRWAAQLLNDIVMSDANNSSAKNLLATAYTQMAYRSENATWRDIYLTGAKELREGVTGKNFMAGGAALMANVPTDQLFDLLAVRLDPAKAKDTKFAIRVQFPERHEDGLVTVRNDVLRYEPFSGQEVDATLSLPRGAFMPILGRAAAPPVGSNVTITGDKAMVERLYSLFSMPDPAFPVVTR